MKCRWKNIDAPDEAGYRRVECVRCGRKSAKTMQPFERIHATCKAWPFWFEFGHWLTFILAAMFITEERVAAVKRALGFTPVCGCKKRSDWLNAIGEALNPNRH